MGLELAARLRNSSVTASSWGSQNSGMVGIPLVTNDGDETLIGVLG